MWQRGRETISIGWFFNRVTNRRMRTQKRRAIEENKISDRGVDSGRCLFRVLNHPVPLRCLLENMETPVAKSFSGFDDPRRGNPEPARTAMSPEDAIRLREFVVPATGLEPVRCYSLEPESSASANSATRAIAMGTL